MIGVSFQDAPDGFARPRLTQPRDEIVVAQAARDVLQGAQMIAGTVLGIGGFSWIWRPKHVFPAKVAFPG